MRIIFLFFFSFMHQQIGKSHIRNIFSVRKILLLPIEDKDEWFCGILTLLWIPRIGEWSQKEDKVESFAGRL